ncbi:MAG TPA: PilZ domain-containing protein [Gallionella sp.]|nr:PilZ domain-containing protein [Gallionella sp.]
MNINYNPFSVGSLSDDDINRAHGSTPYGTEHRRTPRFRVKWKITIDIKGEKSHAGQVKDISTNGASVLLERNLRTSTKVSLRIEIPSLSGHGRSRTIIVHGRIVYTVHDAEMLTFRAGIQFEKFELASDHSYLEARLTEHHMPLRD